jgi:hypothetical protein
MELNVLKDEFPSIFNNKKMLDFNGNVKTNMNNINICFGCTG